MFKNQLQEVAQRSCFNLPSYACIREGPDHAPRFKASVNFNGEVFDGPAYSSTLRQAEHAAAEVALNSLSARGPSRSLTARVLDETGVYKNLLQETAHRAGLKLPSYTTVRSGTSHVPAFTSTVELASMKFAGQSAKTKKQAEKNAAIAAWSALKKMVSLEQQQREDQDHVTVGKLLSNLGPNHLRQPHRHRDHHSKPNSSLISSSQTRQWMLLDHCRDSRSDISGQAQTNSFLSLLPPPPQRTMSRIFPPPMKVVQKPTGSSSVSSSSNLQKGMFPYNFPIVPQSSSTCASQMGRWSTSAQSGGAYGGPKRIAFAAPSVQIRSVIPVCAAPPPLLSQRPSPSSNPKSMQEQPTISESTPSLSRTELAPTTMMGKLNL